MGKKSESKINFAIITATAPEYSAMTSRMKSDGFANDSLTGNTEGSSGMKFAPFSYSKFFGPIGSIVIVRSGFGKVSAAAATQFAIDRFAPAAVVNFGAAGGVSPRATVGTAFVGTTIYDHQHRENEFFLVKRKGKVSGASLYEKIVAAGKSRLFASRWLNACTGLSEGIIASGDEDIDSVEKKERLHSLFAADCADWESFAVARTAQLNRLPWLVLRIVSDGGDEGFAGDYEKNLPAVLEKGAKLVSNCVTKCNS